MSNSDGGTYVVVGGGQAGAWVARTLRDQGFGGRILVIAEESCWPYERPPLSKAFLQGTMDPAGLTLLGPTQAETLRIECHLGRRVAAIDRPRRVISSEDGSPLPYDKLFLTTGAKVRWPSWANKRSARVHVLRTQADAARLRAGIETSRRLLVVGGGWIGLEVAATARAMGCDVTVIEAAPRLCARTMPAIVSDHLLGLHRAEGVSVLLGRLVETLAEDPDGIAATLDDGTIVRADRVVVGIGIEPDTELAEACGLAVKDGIIVDDQGRTSDPDIFAAGDVTRQPSEFVGTSIRLESWANAQNQAIVAAKAALGLPDRHQEVPWLWSDQYQTNLQMLGMPSAATRIVTRGAPESGSGCWLMLDDEGDFAGAVAVNAVGEMRTLRKLLGKGLMPALDAWGNLDIKPQQMPSVARPPRPASSDLG